jgi:membrane-associated phospholipid phosphatase
MKMIVRSATGFLFLPWMIFAQDPPSDMLPRDTTQRHASYAQWVIPSLCVTYGVLSRFNELPFHRWDHAVDTYVDKTIRRNYPIDDYMQYAPAVFAYGLDFIPGITSEHNFRDRTLIMATSYLFAGSVVLGMKSGIPVFRPRGLHDNSFPSGHTMMAFTGAHILFKEYRNQSPWIGIGGYAVATATGAFRVVNRMHWVSDVVTGAGVGVLSVEAAYLMLPVWHRLFHISGSDGRSMVIWPSVGAHSLEIGWVYVF